MAIFFNPPGSRLADIRDFGAVNGQDCSAAFQNAYIWANANASRFANPKPVFVPKGVWLVRYPILSRIGSADAYTNPTLTAIGKVALYDGWQAGMIFIGESTHESIIRVPANSPGFQDTNAPIGVFTTGSELGGSSTAIRQPNPTGGGNIAFRHGIYNLTIIIEANNPGAIGIDSVVTNRGGVEDVRIVDEGGSAKYGLSFHRTGSGPALYKGIVIEGFDHAIWQGTLAGLQKSDYHLTFEDITIANQRAAGFGLNGIVTSIRGLVSYNSVRVLKNISSRSNITLTNATLHKTSVIAKGAVAGVDTEAPALAGTTAITSTGGQLYLKNIINNNAYETTYRDTSVSPARSATSNVSEYFTKFTNSIFTGKNGSSRLNLPVLNAPIFNSQDLQDYVNVEAYGANGRATTPVDCSDAIQQAIDSGKSIVYFPNGTYYISKSIILRGGAVKLIGLTARVARMSSFTGFPFVMADGTSPYVILEHLRFDGLLHDSQRTLVMKHCNCESFGIGTNINFRNTVNSIGGRTFIEDCMASINADFPHDFWCRQLNSEFCADNMRITGGSCWVNGYKTEGDTSRPTTFSTNVRALNGARVQIEGAHMYPLASIPARIAAIEIVDSEVQINFRTGGVGGYATTIRETRGGVTETRNESNTAMFCTRF